MWSFAWWWVLLALPLPWLLRRLQDGRRLESGAALAVPAGNPLAGLAAADGGSARRLLWRAILLWTVWVLALVAAARPQHIGEPISLPVSGRDLLLAVDLSGSMEEQDFELNGVWVDRLTATKSVANAFIERRVGDRVGLILFGREAYLQTPLTFDRETVQTLLDESVIGLAGKETAIGDAIGLGILTLDEAGIEDGRRVLILLTDGANTAGEVNPLKAAELAAERSVVIYTIGIGADVMLQQTLFGVRQFNPSQDLDEDALRQIADMTGGRYFRARDVAEFAEIYDELDRLEPAETDEAGFRPVTEYFYWPLGAAVLLALAGIIIAAFPQWTRGGPARNG
jgi:Ca-activated chloride channel family protein